MGDLMPPAVVQRRLKIGFGSPAIEWLQHDAREFIIDTMHSRDFEDCPVLRDPRALRRRIEGLMNDSGTQYRDAETAWTHFMVYLWYRGMLRGSIRASTQIRQHGCGIG